LPITDRSPGTIGSIGETSDALSDAAASATELRTWNAHAPGERSSIVRASSICEEAMLLAR
jgi:hypothetical protein